MGQTASDFIVLIGWLWKNITTLLGDTFLPVRYVFTFLKQFFYSAFASPITPDTIWTFDAGTKSVFAHIPYFGTMISVAIIGITILMIIFILKTFQRS